MARMRLGVNPKRFILAIDQGTTSSRAVLVDATGTIIGVAQREFAQNFPQPGWVEHDPREILASVQSSIVDVLTRAHVDAKQLAAIGITNQRETAVAWDRTTGAPFGRAIVWQDRRTADRCAELEAGGLLPLVRAKTGLVLDPYFTASKFEWMLRHRDLPADGSLALGTIDSWLIWNLTGGEVHATDATNASRTMLFDITALAWSAELCDVFGVDPASLPRVHPSSGRIGVTSERCGVPGGIPIAGIAGDQQAALFGQACFAPGMAKNTYGTGSFVLMHTGKQAVRSQHGLLGTIAWDLAGEVEYALEGSVFVAGSALQWLRDGLRLIESARESQACAERAESTDGVYFVPAFVGLGAPYWRSDARGAMFGLTRGTRRDQFVRAVLEALAYQTRDVLDAMQADAGARLTTLRADGGAIANDFLAQFQADLLDTPLERPRINEASVLGAAYLAGLAVGIWASRAAIARCWQLERRFVPQMDATRRDRLYAGWKRAVDATLAFGIAAE
jgi:glycerol kinase